MQLCWTDVKKFKFKIFRSFWLLRNWTEKSLVRVILFAPLDEPIVSLCILKCIACYFFCFNWWPWTFCHCSNKEKADQILWTSTVLYFLSLVYTNKNLIFPPRDKDLFVHWSSCSPEICSMKSQWMFSALVWLHSEIIRQLQGRGISLALGGY